MIQHFAWASILVVFSIGCETTNIEPSRVYPEPRHRAYEGAPLPPEAVCHVDIGSPCRVVSLDGTPLSVSATGLELLPGYHEIVLEYTLDSTYFPSDVQPRHVELHHDFLAGKHCEIRLGWKVDFELDLLGANSNKLSVWSDILIRGTALNSWDDWGRDIGAGPETMQLLQSPRSFAVTKDEKPATVFLLYEQTAQAERCLSTMPRPLYGHFFFRESDCANVFINVECRLVALDGTPLENEPVGLWQMPSGRHTLTFINFESPFGRTIEMNVLMEGNDRTVFSMVRLPSTAAPEISEGIREDLVIDLKTGETVELDTDEDGHCQVVQPSEH